MTRGLLLRTKPKNKKGVAISSTIHVTVEGDTMNGDEAVHDNEVIEKILSRIGTEVTFVFPNHEGRMTGILEDRVAMRGEAGPGQNVRFYDVVDRIKFDNKKERWIRVGFYREQDGRLRWAAQTAFTGPENEWERLFNVARQQKPWFADFLRRLCAAMRHGTGPHVD
jgi:hypothetical protein